MKRRAIRSLFVFTVWGLLVSSSVAASDHPETKGDAKKSYGAIDVILYQTSWCRYCAQAKEFLQNSGVSLAIYDIEKDPQRLQEMMVKSGSRGVPVVDIEGIIIRGYSAKAMGEAIEKKRRE